MTAHRHAFAPVTRLHLSLPDAAQRFWLMSVFRCPCGVEDVFTSWSRTTGRHLTRDELREVLRQERTNGAGKTRQGKAQQGGQA